jgi:hypothetical protein
MAARDLLWSFWLSVEVASLLVAHWDCWPFEHGQDNMNQRPRSTVTVTFTSRTPLFPRANKLAPTQSLYCRPLMDNPHPVVHGYYRWADIFYQWAYAFSAESHIRTALKALLAPTALTHEDHPLRSHELGGIELWIGDN